MSILKKNKKSHLVKGMFLDEAVDIARYDHVRYPNIVKITEKQLGFFWRPEEVDVSRDKKDFNALTEHEQHIFTSNLKRQIMLDSIQGRAPNIAFLPISSLPEIETWIETWSFFETIHSRSYTHIIRNIYPNPSVVFDGLLDIKEILETSNDIAKYYDALIEYNNNGKGKLYEHKKALWMCLMAANALEGIRFYVSFACAWAFAELKSMEGNAKIIKFIARDENVHLASTSYMLKALVKDDKDYKKIAQETEEESTQLYIDVINQEKEWAEYLFKDGSMIGLNEKLLADYVDWIGAKRMRAVGLTCPYTAGRINPLPWTEKWISGRNVQPAPQETEISSYIVGGVKQDVDQEQLSKLSL
jgi:ribonucleoside-diphosphate reductase beta chain